MSTYRVAQAGDKGSARDDRAIQQFEKDHNFIDTTFRDGAPGDSDVIVGEITEVLAAAGKPRYGWKSLWVVNVDQLNDATITYDATGASSEITGVNKGFYPYLIELNRDTDATDPSYEVGDRVLVYRVVDQEGLDQYICQANPAADTTPSGIIVMFGGAIVDIPSGYSLCDGTNDGKGNATPDLRGRFVVGSYADTGVPEGEGGVAGALGEDFDYAAPGETGGKTFHGRTENGHPEHDDHKHIIPDVTVESGSGATASKTAGGVTSIQVKQLISGALKQRHGGESDGLNTWVVGSPVDEAQPKNDTDNRPAWYSLAFIRKD